MKRVGRVAAVLAVTVGLPFVAGTRALTQEVEIATSVSMLEGPAMDPQGNVYFTDLLMQRIMRLGTDGKVSIFREKSNVANGLVFDLQGRLVAAEGSTSPTAERNGLQTGGIPRVTRTDLKTGKIEVLADTYDGKPLSGPNDVTIDAKGRLVGVNFDRVWENVANDFGYNPEVARNVVADVRYLLWMLRDVDAAPELVKELTAAR